MNQNKLSIIYIITAYVFVCVFHLYWIHWAGNIPQFLWHGQLMINNPDGYYYGSGAQKIVEGLHKYNPRLTNVWGNGTAVFTAFLAKFFHIRIDTLMLYLPAIISSLVVIPIILIGKLYKNLTWGFLAALVGGIGWSYYNRTLAGYYDTDMFTVLLPMFIIYYLLLSINTKKLNYLLTALIIAIFYPWIYGSGKALLYSLMILYMIFIFIFDKSEFRYKAIILASISLLPFNIFVQLIIVVSLYILFRQKTFPEKYLFYSSIVAFLIFVFGSGFITAILHSIFSYTVTTKSIDNLHFFNVAKTVREAGHIPWFIVFDRMIGSTLGVIIAVIGYILLVKKYKEFIITLPLWGIGFFAFFGGLRFTVYAVPIAAISGVYFFVWLAEKWKKDDKKFKIIIPIVGTIFLIIPNITHIVGCCEKNKSLSSIREIYPLRSNPYLTPTVFRKGEVEVLDNLRKKSNPKDYVITWWDYGYPIWYYADVNTLIDGGKHSEDNFLVSKILTTSNQYLAAHLSKLSVKIYADTNKTVAPQLFVRNNKPINVDYFLEKVGRPDYQTPRLDRNIYLMFPYRMFNIFPTVAVFSNRNLNSGEQYKNHFFYKARLKQEGPYLFIGNIPIDLRSAEIIINNQKFPIKEIDLVGYDNNKKLLVKKQKIRNRGFNIIILKSYGEGLILDDYYYNSLFVQMFVFENYNKELFEPVILNPFMKIYKIK